MGAVQHIAVDSVVTLCDRRCCDIALSVSSLLSPIARPASETVARTAISAYALPHSAEQNGTAATLALRVAWSSMGVLS